MVEVRSPPPLLHLQPGDPVPALPLAPPLRLGSTAIYTLFCIVDGENTVAAVERATHELAERHGLRVAVVARCPPEPAPRSGVDAANLLRYVDDNGAISDRLGAVADADGRRGELLVLVEPRGSVVVSVGGVDAAAWAAALVSLPT